MKSKLVIITVFILLIFIPLWIWFLAPIITKIPDDFSYKADIISLDNFYDEAKQQFLGEKRSVTKFSYDVTDEKDGVFIVKNVFDVRAVNGDNIFAVERFYGIDPKTGKHVAGFGDANRDGYLFAPQHLKKGEPFTYWHINYDGPAQMKFVREENLLGLLVYRYETDYSSVRINQTKNLTNLPGVGVTRGIELEPRLQIWIEPMTGHMVKYQDDTTAYYYDLKTSTRQSPWNHFRNSYASESVVEQVGIAKQEKLNVIFIQFVVPLLFALFAIIIVLFYFRKNKIITFLLFGFLVLVILGGIGIWFVLKIISPPMYTGQVESIRVGAIAEYSTLIRVAEQQGFFKNNGLDVTVTEYTSGAPAFKGLLNDEVDITSAADFVGVRNSFETKDFMILASTFESLHAFELVARKDRDVNVPADLKGKKIGLTKKTMGEFFLGTFLNGHNLSLNDDVILVNGEPAELASAINNGAVDAVVTFNPHSYAIAQKLGTNASVFNIQNNKYLYGLIYSKPSFTKERPDTARRFLQALVEAEQFIASHPSEAENFFAKQFQYSPDYIKSVISQVHFVTSLSQSLLIGMENEAQWAIESKLTDKTIVPNYIDFIYADALRKVKLDAVTVY